MVVALRLALPDEVQVTAPSVEPWPWHEEVDVLLRILGEAVGDACLADVVHAGPDEVADDPGQVFASTPVGGKFADHRLGAVHHATRRLAVLGLIVPDAIIVA